MCPYHLPLIAEVAGFEEKQFCIIKPVGKMAQGEFRMDNYVNPDYGSVVLLTIEVQNYFTLTNAILAVSDTR